MSPHFVKDASEVCRVGDMVSVRVLRVDLDRHRIALTMKPEKGHERKSGPPRQASLEKKTKPYSHPLLTGKVEADLHIIAEKFKGL